MTEALRGGRRPSTPRMRRIVVVLLLTTAAVLLPALASASRLSPLGLHPPIDLQLGSQPGTPSGPLTLKLLAVNDLHGGLSTGQQIGGRPVGGAAYLAAHVKARASRSQHAYVVGAGDMFGASAPVSGLLREEPTVRVMNAMGFLLNTPGNHEFDRGVDELQRLNYGGCRPETGCFEGAHFAQISANVVVQATGAPLFPPYQIEEVEGVPVAFVGATHVDVPSFTRSGAVAGLVFVDPATAINQAVRELKAQGVRAIVVLIHEGGWIDQQSGQLVGPITRIVEALDPEVDVVLSAHTHQRYAVRHAGKLVTQGAADSTAFVDVDLTIDRATGDVADASAQVVTTFDDEVAPDPAVQAVVQQAEAVVIPQIEPIVGVANREISKVEQTPAGETPLGNLLADAQQWRTGADIALVNLFSIRASIPAGDVSWGDLYAVQSYADELVTMTLTGDQIYELFNEQWTLGEDGAEIYRPLQVAGLQVSWSAKRPIGDRIVALTLPDGRPVQRAARYTLVTNRFLAEGGDDCLALRDGRDREIKMSDVEALSDYVQQLPQPFGATIEGRIRRLD